MGTYSLGFSLSYSPLYSDLYSSRAYHHSPDPMPSLSPSASPYIIYFSRVYTRRMRFVVNACVLIALGLAILMFTRWSHFWHSIALAITIRAPAIAIALVIVRLAHLLLVVVALSPAKSLASQLSHVLSSPALLYSLVYFAILAGLWAATNLSQLPLLSEAIMTPVEYGALRYINDEFAYYWFHYFLHATVYAAIFVFGQRNRVLIPPTVAHTPPDKVLFTGFHIIALNSLLLALLVNLIVPLAYVVCRPSVYRVLMPLLWILGLDTAISPLGVSWRTFCNASYSCTFLVFAWELVHRFFVVYATVGCLDGSKPISCASPDPIHSLLAGLKDENPVVPLTRVTAFQELVFIASSQSPEAAKLRAAIFSTRSRDGSAWDSILNECFRVIRETNGKINYRTTADIEALLRPQTIPSAAAPHDFMFGNGSRSFEKQPDVPGVAQYESRTKPPSTLKLCIALLRKFVFAPLWRLVFKSAAADIAPSNRLLAPAFLQRAKATFHSLRSDFYSLSVGTWFRITPARDASTRIPIPSIYESAILASSYLLIRSISEDKLLVVTNFHIRDVLQELEVLVRSCKNYIFCLPALVYTADPAALRPPLITRLHNVCMDRFFEVCVKFNYKLNDLTLNHRTQKLAKELMEEVVSKQQQQKQQRGMPWP